MASSRCCARSWPTRWTSSPRPTRATHSTALSSRSWCGRCFGRPTGCSLRSRWRASSPAPAASPRAASSAGRGTATTSARRDRPVALDGRGDRTVSRRRGAARPAPAGAALPPGGLGARAPGARRALHLPAPRRGDLDRSRRLGAARALRAARAHASRFGRRRCRRGSRAVPRRGRGARAHPVARAGGGDARRGEAGLGDSGPPLLPDELWLAVVLSWRPRHRRAQVSRDHLVQAAVPLYLGRVAAFHAASACDSPAVVKRKLEELCLRFSDRVPSSQHSGPPQRGEP